MQELVQKIPDSPEAWYGLGDKYYHDGALHGVTDADERALAAFRRALALDTRHARPVPMRSRSPHFADLALAAGDSATVRHLLSARAGPGLDRRVHREASAGPGQGLRRYRGDRATACDSRPGQLPHPSHDDLGQSGARRGGEGGAARRSISLARRVETETRARRRPSGFIRLLAHDLALNRGRPHEALAVEALRYVPSEAGGRSDPDRRCPLLGRGYHRRGRGGGEDRQGYRRPPPLGRRLVAPLVLLRSLYARAVAPGAW